MKSRIVTSFNRSRSTLANLLKFRSDRFNIPRPVSLWSVAAKPTVNMLMPPWFIILRSLIAARRLQLSYEIIMASPFKQIIVRRLI